MEFWIMTEGTGHYFFYAFPICLLALFFILKNRRIRFVFPSLIISIIIVNPWFYNYWEKLGLYAYWRILWIVPVVPVVAALVPAFTEKIGNKNRTSETDVSLHEFKKVSLAKFIIVIIGIAGIILGGSFVYNTERGQFNSPAKNSSKLPNEVVQIADRLLKLDDNPRVIAQDPIGVYLRQYTGKVDSLFGRDIYGHISSPSSITKTVKPLIDSPSGNEKLIAQIMLDEGYSYLVTSSEITSDFLSCIDKVDEYYIYKPNGTPSVFKKRNELGQVVSITSIDEYGEPKNTDQGYSTISYEYDNNGNIALELYSDCKGKRLFGTKYEYNTKNQVALMMYLDCNGDPCMQPGGYYGYKQTYDDNGRLLTRIYVDHEGNCVNRTDGYSKVVWHTNAEGVQHIELYDSENSKIAIENINLATNLKTSFGGWSEWMTPEPEANNCCFLIGTFSLGESHSGDIYTCQIEIEFRDVKAAPEGKFRIKSQGQADGSWTVGNPWNECVWVSSAPEDGIYYYSGSCTIDEFMEKTSAFQIGFRCDYWASGSFRVKSVKIEKSEFASEWSPGI